MSGMVSTRMHRALRYGMLLLSGIALKPTAFSLAILLVQRLQQLTGVLLDQARRQPKRVLRLRHGLLVDCPSTAPHTWHESPLHPLLVVAFPHRCAGQRKESQVPEPQFLLSAIAVAPSDPVPSGNKSADYDRWHLANSHHLRLQHHAVFELLPPSISYRPSRFHSAIAP
jgi:hypothetical protein